MVALFGDLLTTNKKNDTTIFPITTFFLPNSPHSKLKIWC